MLPVLFQHSLPLNSNYGFPNHVKVCRRRMKMESSACTLSTEYIYILYTDPEIGVEDSNCVTCFSNFPFVYLDLEKQYYSSQFPSLFIF